jgi:hypothetical protein
MSITVGMRNNDIPQAGLVVYLDAANTASYPGSGTTWYDLSGYNNHFTILATAYNSSGVKYMDFNGSYGLAKASSGTIVGVTGKEHGHCTYIVWTRVKNSTAEWRTLTRGLGSAGTSDHNVIYQSGGWSIGMYDGTNGSGFQNTGFSQQSLPSYNTTNWDMHVYRYSSASPQFRFSYNDTPGTIRGSVSSLNAAYKYGFNSLGGYGNDVGTDASSGSQYWGDIGAFMCWNRELTDAECLQVYNAMAPRFRGASQLTESAVTYSAGLRSTTQSTAIPTNNQGELISITPYASAGSYTWSKPSGCTRVMVKVVGGGGGACGYSESGGAGGYSEKTIDVTNVSSVTVTVGGGGASSGYYSAASDGGTSSFGSYCSASGGYGANRNYSHTGGHGGVGSNGQFNLYGGDGSGHCNGHGYFPGGDGGGSYWGGSSVVRRDTTSTKLNVGAPGSGGPGGRTDDGGGGGAAYGETGMVVVYAYR